MQTPKARNSPSEGPKKVSPRAVRQLNTTSAEYNSASSSNVICRTPKERSPKVVERKSPRSPLSESQKKRPSRLSELEAQVSQLQQDLKEAKDQLSSSESWKTQAQQEAEESKKQLLDMSSKLEESKQQINQLTASNEARVVELQKISQDLSHNELQSLKGNLAGTLSLIEDMKNQLRDCKESEAQAQALVSETLLQLEAAKTTVETLRLDGIKAMEAYNDIASELEQSRVRVNLLEGLVSKHEADQIEVGCNNHQNTEANPKVDLEIEANGKVGGSDQLEAELVHVKSELTKLKAALETAEGKYHEEKIRSTVEIRSAYELSEQLKSASSEREVELREEIEKRKADIEELKANLMDKETELQGISEENEGLNMRLEKALSCQKEYEIGEELNRTTKYIADLKANLMDKETELQNILEENEMLKSELKKKMDAGHDEVIKESEVARAAEREAVMKLGYMTEEAEKSSRRAARVAEQLDAAQAANMEMEAELRRLKVQSDQWRKAAEAATAMLTAGNNGNFMERTGSLDSDYNSMTGQISSPYSEDMDDDSFKKKNGNMLKKIGVLWKRPPK